LRDVCPAAEAAMAVLAITDTIRIHVEERAPGVRISHLMDAMARAGAAVPLTPSASIRR
jgi:hypothetical protein